MYEPQVPCPNCKSNEWTEELQPQETKSVTNVAGGQADIIDNKGFVYTIYKCKGCHFAMFFLRTQD